MNVSDAQRLKALEAEKTKLKKLLANQPDEAWSMDFVFDELANGRRIKTLTIVDDCCKDAVQFAVDTSIPRRCTHSGA